jgi:hypothetical protein
VESVDEDRNELIGVTLIFDKKPSVGSRRRAAFFIEKLCFLHEKISRARVLKA